MNPAASTSILIQLSPEQLTALVAEAVRKALSAQQQSPGFMRSKEAADFLGMSEWALRAAERKGQIPAHRLGGRVLYDAAELHEFVVSGRGEA
jgi:excisionase family DNA binding protein